MQNSVLFQKTQSKFSTLICWGVFFALLIAYLRIYLEFLPLENGNIGHDFSLLFPAWLDGQIWFKNNGWETPWFTPSFCAGQPFFPDPNSIFYSLPQVLSFVFNPIDVAVLTLIVTASLAFWGSYLLMRYVFLTHRNTALLVAGLMMLNGFLPHRLIVGHLTFHGFALVTWVALFLLLPIASRIQQIFAALVAGAMMSYWVHSGLGVLVIAACLAVWIIILLAALRGAHLANIVKRGLLAGLFALALSASKLWAGFAFLSHFPRNLYKLPGAASVVDEISVFWDGLFLPSQKAYAVGGPKIHNLQWALAPHEWAYNFSIVVFVLIIFLAAYSLYQLRQRILPYLANYRHSGLIVMFILSLSVPFMLNYWSPAWNEILKSTPVLSSMSTPLRWVIVFIPIIAIALGLLSDQLQHKSWGAALLLVCLGGSLLESMNEPRDYYAFQSYPVRPLMVGDQLFKAGVLPTQITRIDVAASLPLQAGALALRGNDTMIAGVSQVACYNAIFGYKLEKFSAAGLQPAPVLSESNGFLNLKNPACYIYPNENHCKPGDQFRADQLEQATRFVNYQPFSFEMSTGQKIANLVSKTAWWMLLLALLSWSILWLRTRLRRDPEK